MGYSVMAPSGGRIHVMRDGSGSLHQMGPHVSSACRVHESDVRRAPRSPGAYSNSIQFLCESSLSWSTFKRASSASAGDQRWVELDYALGRQLYAIRRWSGTNVIVCTGLEETGLEGRLLRS